MSKKMITPLHHFAFNRRAFLGSVQVEWFYYDLDPATEENIRGFSESELQLFQAFALENNLNFAGDKNVHLTDEGDAPMEFPNDRYADALLDMPCLLLLKPSPQVVRTEAVAKLMEIVLLTEKHKQNHRYDLPFGAIGRVFPK